MPSRFPILALAASVLLVPGAAFAQATGHRPGPVTSGACSAYLRTMVVSGCGDVVVLVGTTTPAADTATVYDSNHVLQFSLPFPGRTPVFLGEVVGWTPAPGERYSVALSNERGFPGRSYLICVVPLRL